LRVCEPLNLRVKDVDIDRLQLRLWETKGSKCRVVPIPVALVEDLRAQMKVARAMWERDQRSGLPVALPGLWRKKAKGHAKAWGWFWLFPAHGSCVDERSGLTVRWRCHEANVQRAVKRAAEKIGMGGMITPHNLRHAYGTHVMECGGNVCDLQQAMGHKYLETTQGYVHSDGLRVASPLDAWRPPGGGRMADGRGENGEGRERRGLMVMEA
jgi:site-specific recombinase XerD